MRLNPMQKGSTILEFIVILPVLFSFLVVFIDLTMVFYTQLRLDNTLFGLQQKENNEDLMRFIQDRLVLQGFKLDYLMLNLEEDFIVVHYRQPFLTPFIAALIKKDYIELTSYINLSQDRIHEEIL